MGFEIVRKQCNSYKPPRWAETLVYIKAMGGLLSPNMWCHEILVTQYMCIQQYNDTMPDVTNSYLDGFF